MNHIAQLGRLAGDLRERGYKVLVIGKSDDETAQETAEAFAGHLELLNDGDLTVYQLYGFGKFAWTIQRSGTVLVNKNGVIEYVHRTTNPKSSVKKEELLAALG